MGYRRFIPKSLTVAIVIILAVSGCKQINLPAAVPPDGCRRVPRRCPSAFLTPLFGSWTKNPRICRSSPLAFRSHNKRDRFLRRSRSRHGESCGRVAC